MRRCLAVLVVWVLASVVGACGEDATTIPGPTTVQSANTTFDAPGPKDTTSTVANEATARTTTTPVRADTSATDSTSEPAPGDQTLVLRHDGLGVVSFGQPVDTVVAVLTALLGPPDLEEVQVSPDMDRDVQWDEPFLYLQFTTWIFGVDKPDSVPNGPILHYYVTTSDRFATDAGIATGSTVTELETAYPDVVFHQPCGDLIPEFLLDNGSGWPELPIFGLLDGDSANPRTRIVHIGAGWDRTPC